MGFKIKDKITLYLPENDLFKKSKKKIEIITGSKIVFGEIHGEKFEFEFDKKRYKFGIET